jgi:DNA-binding transcriptional ArsR family regulator
MKSCLKPRVDQSTAPSAQPDQKPKARARCGLTSILDGADGYVLGSWIPRFELQFPAGEIEQLAARFAYEDDARCRDAGAAARARGNYTRAELLEVCGWKSPRSSSRVVANSSTIVASATRAAFATSDEAGRMSALTSLSGVGVPTASALLMFAFPDDYPILDVRALESLGVKPRAQYPITFWLAYLECCRELAHRYDVHIRTLDKALWQHSKDRSARASGHRVPHNAVYDRALVPGEEEGQVVIDRLRAQIQERLDQLAGEADRLRKALAALDPRSSNAPARKPVRAAASEPKGPATDSAPARRTSQAAARSSRRTAPGTTNASVLAALDGGEAMTAGEVAGKTGLARPTVSTTLSKLAKSGELQKAERGYRLASAAPSSPAK